MLRYRYALLIYKPLVPILTEISIQQTEISLNQ